MNMVNLLLQRAEENDKPAIIEKGKEVTFQELSKNGMSMAAFLQAKGIQKADPVLVLQPMSIKLYQVLVGLWILGAIPVMFDPSRGRKFIQSCCDVIMPQAFIGSNIAHLLQFYAPCFTRIPIKIATAKHPWIPSIPTSTFINRMSPCDVTEEFPAIITFTSGSTGRPKAAVRSHGFLVKQYEILKSNLQYSKDTVDLATLPVFTLANLASGMTTVIPDSSLSKVEKIRAKKVVSQIIQHNITRITASPSFIKAIVNYCLKKQMVITSILEVHAGGGPVFPSLMEMTNQVMPNAKILAVYGSTEAEPIAEITYTEVSEFVKGPHPIYGLPAGRPVPQIQCRIIQEQWGKSLGVLTSEQFEKLCLQGTPGEIVVSGEHVLQGYLHGHGDSENKFDVEKERWHRTGDVGQFDETGRLWLLGRANAKVEDEKGVVYPLAMESTLNQKFQIDRTALISIQGKRVLVFEKKDRIPSKYEIEKCIPWAKIDRILSLTKIPVDKRHNAKIDYIRLKDMVAKKMKSF